MGRRSAPTSISIPPGRAGVATRSCGAGATTTPSRPTTATRRPPFTSYEEARAAFEEIIEDIEEVEEVEED
jgi:hypothetical protein